MAKVRAVLRTAAVRSFVTALGVVGVVVVAASFDEADAGEAHSSPFTVSVDLRPAFTADACMLSTEVAALRVSCGAPTALLNGNTPQLAGTVAPARPGVDTSGAVEVLRTGSTGESSPADFLAPPHREDRVIDPENIFSTFISLILEPGTKVQSPTRFGEYSSRTIVVGGLEYLEMTVSW